MTKNAELKDNEVQFLSSNVVKGGLHIKEVHDLQQKVSTAQRARFDNSVALAKVVNTAFEWFESPDAKAIMVKKDIKWTKEDFSIKVFGFQKSYFYKLIKVAKAVKADPEIAERFLLACDEAEANGTESNRSIAELLSYIQKGGKLAPDADGDGDGEEGEGDASDAKNKGYNIILTIGGAKQQITVNPDGTVTCKDLEAFKDAIQMVVDTINRAKHIAEAKAAEPVVVDVPVEDLVDDDEAEEDRVVAPVKTLPAKKAVKSPAKKQ